MTLRAMNTLIPGLTPHESAIDLPAYIIILRIGLILIFIFV